MGVRPPNLRLATTASMVAAAAAVVVASGDAHSHAPPWRLANVVGRIDGSKVLIGAWSGRVQADSTQCNGEGPGVRYMSFRRWRHFTCTWTVFDGRGRVGRDVTFRVHTLTRTRLLISSARFGQG